MKILAAEDDKLTSRALQSVLQNDGYVTYFAFDGKEAIEMIEKQKPDLIITDIMLPLISGLEIIKHVKRSEELKHIPIIVISMIEKEETIMKAFDLGAVDFIPKPFSGQDLSLRIKKIINSRS